MWQAFIFYVDLEIIILAISSGKEKKLDLKVASGKYNKEKQESIIKNSLKNHNTAEQRPTIQVPTLQPNKGEKQNILVQQSYVYVNVCTVY